jgi:hypothetical protein
MMKGSLHCMQEIIHSTGTTLKYHINTNLRGNVSTFNPQLNMNDGRTKEDQLWKAIKDGDVPTVQTLLTRYPDLIRYRDFYVSPSSLYVTDDITVLLFADLSSTTCVIAFNADAVNNVAVYVCINYAYVLVVLYRIILFMLCY